MGTDRDANAGTDAAMQVENGRNGNATLGAYTGGPLPLPKGGEKYTRGICKGLSMCCCLFICSPSDDFCICSGPSGGRAGLDLATALAFQGCACLALACTPSLASFSRYFDFRRWRHHEPTSSLACRLSTSCPCPPPRCFKVRRGERSTLQLLYASSWNGMA